MRKLRIGRVCIGLATFLIAPVAMAQPPAASAPAQPPEALPPADIREPTAEETRVMDRHWRYIGRYTAGAGHANALADEYPPLLALAEQTYGPDHPLTLNVRLVKATSLGQTLAHEAAEQLAATTLAALARRVGPEHPRVLTGTIQRVFNLVNWGRPQQAEALIAPLEPMIVRAFGEDSVEHASILAGLAFVHRAQGRFAEAERLSRRALTIREARLEGADPLLATTRAAVALAMIGQGRYAEAETFIAAALPGDPADHIGGARLAEARGELRIAQGRYADAERDLRRASALFLAHAGFDSPEYHVASAKTRMAISRLRTASPLEEGLAISTDWRCRADPAHLTGWWTARAIAVGLRDADAVPCRRKVLTFAERELGAGHPHTAIAMQELAESLLRTGQSEEAERLARRALAIQLNAGGNDHPATVQTFAVLSEILAASGRREEAEGVALRSGASQENVAQIRQLIRQAQLAEAAGRFEDAAPIWEEIEGRGEQIGQNFPLAIAAINGRVFNKLMMGRCEDLDHASLATAAANARSLNWVAGRAPLDEALAVSEACRGRWAEAASVYTQVASSEIGRAGLSARFSPDTALVETRRALTMLRHPSTLEQAAEASQNAAGIARQRRDATVIEGNRIGGARQLTGNAGDDPLAAAFVAQLRTSWALVQRDVGPAPQIHHRPLTVEEAVAQIRAGNPDPDPPPASPHSHLGATAFEAAQDVSMSAAAQSLLRAAARATIEDPGLADLIGRQQALSDRLALSERSLFANLGAIDPALLRELDAGKAELDRLNAEVQRRDPRYAELVRPNAAAVTAVQARLRPGEGLLFVQPAWDDVYVFALTNRRFHWHKVSLDTPALDEMVRQLRCGLDGAACQAGETANSPFDFALAHELYREVVSPVEGALAGANQLFVVASGSLGGLPLGLLVSEPVADGADMRSAPWLAERYAMVTLPSISSLRAFEQTPARAHATEFTGYGNPVLGPPVEPDPRRPIRRGATRFADVASIRALPSLPGTARELNAMARALGAPETSVRLGIEATEAAVKRDPAIAQSRILVFATHGVLPGGAAGFQEPGLIFTPPATASAADDGLLTASEAAALDLSADWLILSACNTASTDGRPGGEALSGLSRAFLYAGARSLLASHWQVSDDATAALTVEALRIGRARSDLSRAQAMQAAMRAVRTGTTIDGAPLAGWRPAWSDPWFWAPFVLIESGN